MATFKYCKKCGKVTERKKIQEFSGGISTTKYICSVCKNIEQDSINHIHYGNDEYKSN